MSLNKRSKVIKRVLIYFIVIIIGALTYFCEAEASKNSYKADTIGFIGDYTESFDNHDSLSEMTDWTFDETCTIFKDTGQLFIYSDSSNSHNRAILTGKEFYVDCKLSCTLNPHGRESTYIYFYFRNEKNYLALKINAVNEDGATQESGLRIVRRTESNSYDEILATNTTARPHDFVEQRYVIYYDRDGYVSVYQNGKSVFNKTYIGEALNDGASVGVGTTWNSAEVDDFEFTAKSFKGPQIMHGFKFEVSRDNNEQITDIKVNSIDTSEKITLLGTYNPSSKVFVFGYLTLEPVGKVVEKNGYIYLVKDSLELNGEIINDIFTIDLKAGEETTVYIRCENAIQSAKCRILFDSNDLDISVKQQMFSDDNIKRKYQIGTVYTDSDGITTGYFAEKRLTGEIKIASVILTREAFGGNIIKLTLRSKISGKTSLVLADCETSEISSGEAVFSAGLIFGQDNQ